MPLSTVCVSTVSSRPRAWSYTNLHTKNVQLTSMNSAEEISTLNNYYSPTLTRRLQGYTYGLPDKSPKKEKKWTISSLFRRKKKDDSDSSSEDEKKVGGFLKKKKSDTKKKKKKQAVTFDHVVMPRNLYSNGHNDESGILSDPTGGFASYAGRTISKNSKLPEPTIQMNDLNNSINSIGSNDSSVKRNRKDFAKIRAVARRTTTRKNESSSDDDSLSSIKFKSDDNLRDSGSRKSRSARTERYLKRHSRDGENPKNYLRLSKSDVENSGFSLKLSDDNRSPSKSPNVLSLKLKHSYSSLSSQSPSLTGLSTIPPSHGSHSKIRVSNSTSNPNYKPPLSMNEYNNSTRSISRLNCNNFNNNQQRSVSCDSNIHKAPSTEIEPEIMHIQFPLTKPNSRLRNLSAIDAYQVNQSKQPPPPPPRDPRRLLNMHYHDNGGRPTTYYFDNSGQMKSKSFHSNQPHYQPKKMNSFHFHANHRSTSEDHLPKSHIQLHPRPSSATPDTTLTNKCLHQENYNYLADKKPRSRKPIFIKSNQNISKENNRNETAAKHFLSQKNKEDNLSIKSSPKMFHSQTTVQSQIFLPSVLQTDLNTNGDLDERLSSPFKPISSENSDVAKDCCLIGDRKSTNLEEALDELEAIYNSLRLGDEDLLERAEQREKDAAVKKLIEKGDYYPNWGLSRGTLSDSSFSYEPFDTVDSPRRKRLIKKSQTVDRRADDMAYRKLNKEKSSTIADPQSVVSKVSYLLASPIYKDYRDENKRKKTKEPDVTLDDVVYRNIKYSNNSLKVVDPQPPFGIPLGPIAPSANSDYLHAVPDDMPRPIFKPRKIPDLVKDDLAFRNLRKDTHKEEPALPPVSPDDMKNNNNNTTLDVNILKKKRAVRSLSANIGCLINQNNNDEDGTDNEFKTLTDIADAMEIARQVLREKENKISATKRAFMSDTDTKNGNTCSSFTESRLNFLNSLKSPILNDEKGCFNFAQGKPPTFERMLSSDSKEATSVAVKEKVEYKTTSFDDLLTALALEARETSERITSELKQYSKENKDIDKQLSDIDAVSEQAKLCEKMLEGVVDSTDLMVDCKTLERDEKVEPIHMKSDETLANTILTNGNPKSMASESEHDYENLMSDVELMIIDGVEVEKCASPFEEHKAELIASFQDLKNGADDCCRRNTQDDKGKTDSVYDNYQVATVIKDNNEKVTGEQCASVVDAASIKECAYVEFNNFNTTFVSSCDIVVSDLNCNLDCNQINSDENSNESYLNSLESLKSPKLVLETAKLSNQCQQSPPGTSTTALMESNTNRYSSNLNVVPGHILVDDDDDDDDDQKPTPAWYRDPATVAVACSYGIACAHQLASLDYVAILSILFAVISFIAALFF